MSEAGAWEAAGHLQHAQALQQRACRHEDLDGISSSIICAFSARFSQHHPGLLSA